MTWTLYMCVNVDVLGVYNNNKKMLKQKLFGLMKKNFNRVTLNVLRRSNGMLSVYKKLVLKSFKEN